MVLATSSKEGVKAKALSLSVAEPVAGVGAGVTTVTDGEEVTVTVIGPLETPPMFGIEATSAAKFCAMALASLERAVCTELTVVPTGGVMVASTTTDPARSSTST